MYVICVMCGSTFLEMKKKYKKERGEKKGMDVDRYLDIYPKVRGGLVLSDLILSHLVSSCLTLSAYGYGYG